VHYRAVYPRLFQTQNIGEIGWEQAGVNRPSLLVLFLGLLLFLGPVLFLRLVFLPAFHSPCTLLVDKEKCGRLLGYCRSARMTDSPHRLIHTRVGAVKIVTWQLTE